MAGKTDKITELYQSALKEITSDSEKWTSFLKSACQNFRLPFDEQLLVYVQRPKAKAVLEIGDWNKRFGRTVIRRKAEMLIYIHLFRYGR